MDQNRSFHLVVVALTLSLSYNSISMSFARGVRHFADHQPVVFACIVSLKYSMIKINYSFLQLFFLSSTFKMFLIHIYINSRLLALDLCFSLLLLYLFDQRSDYPRINGRKQVLLEKSNKFFVYLITT